MLTFDFSKLFGVFLHKLVCSSSDLCSVVLVRTIGSYGSGNGQFCCPHGVLIDGQGRIIVSDSCNHRIQVLQ
jgi:hypothetical protein